MTISVGGSLLCCKMQTDFLLHPISYFVAYDILCGKRAADLNKHGPQCNFAIKSHVFAPILAIQPIFMALAGKVAPALQYGINTFFYH